MILPDRDKLEAMAEFAAGAGHEINNPLATILGRVQLLLKNETDPERRQSLLSIASQAYRIRDMIGDAMLFGRPPKPEPELVLVGEVWADVTDGLKSQRERPDCKLVLQAEPKLQIRADRLQFRIVLTELLRNSIEASDPDCVVTTAAELLDNGFVKIEIIDHGQGFTDEEREHLFDPFYSGRQAGRGLGFGLSKCWRIVTLHDGTIEVHSKENTTRVVIHWPSSAETMTGK